MSTRRDALPRLGGQEEGVGWGGRAGGACRPLAASAPEQPRGSVRREPSAPPAFPFSAEQPVSSLAGGFPRGALPGRPLLFPALPAGRNCGETPRRPGRSSLRAASFPSRSGHLGRPGSGGQGGAQLDRGAREPGVPAFTFQPRPLASPQLPAPRRPARARASPAQGRRGGGVGGRGDIFLP